MTSEKAPDRVRAQRAQAARWVSLGKRVGYLGLLLAIIAFAFGFQLGFPRWTTALAIAGFVVSCVTLPVAVTFGYGVRAAEREDRALGR